MQPFSVMTFNVRQADGEDGNQSWPYRKVALIETIQAINPMLLGTQENFPEQTEYILDRLPQYHSFGRGRFGDDRNMHNKIFFHREWATLGESGEIWLSETPDVPGSVAWGIPRPRMITWGMLYLADGARLMAINTHFPYHANSEEARRHSARRLNTKLDSLEAQLPVIVTGDFNAVAGGETYQALTQHLDDAWTAAQKRTGPESTVHGFGRYEGPRIDWILYRHCGSVREAETITRTFDGLYPSDHYPVYARFA